MELPFSLHIFNLNPKPVVNVFLKTNSMLRWKKHWLSSETGWAMGHYRHNTAGFLFSVKILYLSTEDILILPKQQMLLLTHYETEL